MYLISLSPNSPSTLPDHNKIYIFSLSLSQTEENRKEKNNKKTSDFIMKRGESAGGGQSSLGYLFGSDNKQKNQAPPPSPTTYMPPYGIDVSDDKPPESPPPSLDKTKVSSNYNRVQRQNSGNFITVSTLINFHENISKFQ